jgi:hypothetical protein
VGRNRRHVFTRAYAPSYLVVWDLHWRVIDSHPVSPAADPRAQFEAAIGELAAAGWSAESAGKFGFTFVARAGERRLIALTPRDPFRTGSQSFSPFAD